MRYSFFSQIFTFYCTTGKMGQFPIFLNATSTGSQYLYINHVKWSVKTAHLNTYSLVGIEFASPGNESSEQEPLCYKHLKKYFQMMILSLFFTIFVEWNCRKLTQKIVDISTISINSITLKIKKILDLWLKVIFRGPEKK